MCCIVQEDKNRLLYIVTRKYNSTSVQRLCFQQGAGKCVPAAPSKHHAYAYVASCPVSCQWLLLKMAKALLLIPCHKYIKEFVGYFHRFKFQSKPI